MIHRYIGVLGFCLLSCSNEVNVGMFTAYEHNQLPTHSLKLNSCQGHRINHLLRHKHVDGHPKQSVRMQKHLSV